MTIRIHLGAHKTATSELQYALRTVRGRLARGGLGYLGPRALRSESLPLYAAMHETHPEAAPKLRAGLADWLGAHEHHLISEENIIGSTYRGSMFGAGGQLYPHAATNLARLLDLMGHPQVELFLSLRDPALFVTSAYGQQLRMGVSIDIDSYIKGVDIAALSWADLARRLLAVPGVTRLIVWRYEYYNALRPLLLERMLGPALAAIVPPPSRRNAGISAAAYNALLQTAMEDLDTPVAELVRQACAAHPRVRGVPSMRPLRPRLYLRSRRAYMHDLAEMAGIERVEMLRREDVLAPQDADAGQDEDEPDADPA
ncbi:MAG: hypothetical protein Q4G25_13625 [Paracoccus sp. (in: a-proteobacteria)]|nr:hypothetical protein [Paracoccus sp. (in: a-proteobacteria)]